MRKPKLDEKIEFRPEQSLGYLVRDTHRAFIRALHARIIGHGITKGQWFFLRALWEEEGLTQRELSQRVGMMEPPLLKARAQCLRIRQKN